MRRSISVLADAKLTTTAGVHPSLSRRRGSAQARKELAAELKCPASLMADSAQMNMWLHNEVMKRVAANGGIVPADLLD